MVEYFCFQKFLTLEGMQLEEYMGRMFHGGESCFAHDSVELLRSAMSSLDAEHQTYAIEALAISGVSGVEEILIPYLASREASVCSAAFRAILRLKSNLLPSHFERIAEIPIVQLCSLGVNGNGVTVPVGSNTTFLNELLQLNHAPD
jgi:hypothetical protein